MPPTQSARPNLAARSLLLLDRLEMRWAHNTQIGGLWVGYWGSGEFQRVFDRVEGAVRVIERYDPVRYARLLRDLDRIFVKLLPGTRAQFRHALNSCELDERFVLGDATRPDEIASMIVHEATHARLMRCGIGYEPELRARVEAVCIRRQLAFAAKLPKGEKVKAEAEWALTEIPSDYWTNEAMHNRHYQGMAEVLRFQGAPDFLVRAVLRIRALVEGIRNLTRKLKRIFATSE